jgi:hypothetical protein
MIILWLIAGASLTASIAALISVRRTARRLEDLSQMYWGLRYQQGELRAHIQATGGQVGAAVKPDEAPTPGRGPAEAFVPLSSVRR